MQYDLAFSLFFFLFVFNSNATKQVIMDVVFNHTAEGNENGPILSFRGVDNSVYYMLAPKVFLVQPFQYAYAIFNQRNDNF